MFSVLMKLTCNRTKMEGWIERANIFSHGKSNLCDVFIAFFDIKSVIFTKEISDNNCRTLVLQVKTDDEIYLLVNLYTSNTEQEQLETLHELETFLLKYDVNEYNRIIFQVTLTFFSTLPWKQQVGMLNWKRTRLANFWN